MRLSAFGTILVRILSVIITIYLAITLIFVLIRVVPGDPVAILLGGEATGEMIETYRHELGFDQPLQIQYVRFWQDLLAGKFGISLMTKRDALQDILTYFPASLELCLVAILGFGFVGGILLGVLSSLRKNKFMDAFSNLFSITSISLPQFFIGLLLQLVFGLTLMWLPITGRVGIDLFPPTKITGLYVLDSILTLNTVALVSSITHLILPAITLGLAPLAQTATVVRGRMIEESMKDYIQQCRACGLPNRLIVFKYMLKNAISPAITMIGISFGWGLGFAFVVETVFAWPGMCRYAAEATVYKDFSPVIATTFVMIIVYITINLILDLIRSYLDPRIRYGV